MSQGPILTIVVPIFNMQDCLRKNLSTYCDKRFIGRLEVLCVDNASTDCSKRIVAEYCNKMPDIFSLHSRDADLYGAALNDGLQLASGKYFRIIDADDWVNTNALVAFIDSLEKTNADIVLSDYTTVDMTTQKEKDIAAAKKGAIYGKVYTSFGIARKTLPSTHATTYRTALLKDAHFQMENELFFVDEEFIIVPYLYAETLLYLPHNVYRYQIGNPQQCTAPRNREKYLLHREQILKKLIKIYHRSLQEGPNCKGHEYCFDRISRGLGDHFTTFYMYVEDRSAGRRAARDWKRYILSSASDFWPAVRTKALLLKMLNVLGVSLPQYEKLKALIWKDV